MHHCKRHLCASARYKDIRTIVRPALVRRMPLLTIIYHLNLWQKPTEETSKAESHTFRREKLFVLYSQVYCTWRQSASEDLEITPTIHFMTMAIQLLHGLHHQANAFTPFALSA